MDASPARDQLDELWNSFVAPPDESRPHVWWHWMDGNIDAAGIERDLRWMHRVGIRGAHMFDGGMGGELLVDEAVRPGSAAWAEAIRTAVQTAAELGMELGVATSSGWSAAGAPWVRPEDAMKKVVWAETVVDGDRTVEARIPLPALPTTPGVFQDAPLWGATPAAGHCTSWRVIAFPDDDAHDPLRPASVTASAEPGDVAALVDGSYAAGIELPRDPDGRSSAWVRYDFDAPVTVRSVQIGLAGPTGFGAAPMPHAVLEVEGPAGSWEAIADLAPGTVPARSATFDAVTARSFRLVVSGDSAAAALPPQAPGVRLPPVLRTMDRFVITQFALRSGARVHHAETKAAFGVESDYYAVDTVTDAAGQGSAVAASDVIDLSGHVHGEHLVWTPPPGRWRVLHLGASLTGKTNGPAPADATGLEIDKLDGARVSAYLDQHLERFGTVDDGGRWITALLSDSIESGSQNWTDSLADDFARLRGYDPTAHLPALAGYVIDDPVSTDRFLYDYRRTIAELLAGEYYGTLAAAAHRHGLTYYAEALEDGRPQLGDDLGMRAFADVPMGAAWTFDAADGSKPTYVADLKGASSVAHVHGRDRTGAEAFTAFDRPWSYSPRALKHVADLQLALGVTRFCIHSSPHQPLAAPAPGVSLAPFLGQAFTSHETWAEFANPWTDYLARGSAMLSAGEPDVDLAVFVGEEAPVTGLFEHRLDDVVPEGFDFDYVGADALRDVLRMADGELRSHGSRYRALVLSGTSHRMTVEALRAIERLVDAGATVIGMPPESSPSLADDPVEFAGLRERLWSASRTRDRVIARPLAEALQEIGLHPRIEVVGAEVRRVGRRLREDRVLFLANPSDEPVEVTITTAGAGPLSLWDPVSVTRTALRTEGDASVAVALDRFGSAFIVTAPAGERPARAARPIPLTGRWRIALPGMAEAELQHPSPWTDLGSAERSFSGVGVYRCTFDVDTADEHLELDLGEVREIARVVVNGVDCGIAWTAPFRVRVGHALRARDNLLEVHVATPWRNRLIAEAAAPSGELIAATTRVYLPSAEPMVAGLVGPVRLMATDQ